MDITTTSREFDVEALQQLAFGAYDPMTALSAFDHELEKIAGFGSMLGGGLEGIGKMFGRAAEHMPGGQFRGLLQAPAEGFMQRGLRNAGEVAQDLGTRVSARAAAAPSLAQRAGQVVGAGERAMSSAARRVGEVQQGVGNLVGGVQQGVKNIGTEFRAGRAGISTAEQAAADTAAAAKNKGMEFAGQIPTPTNISGRPASTQPVTGQVFTQSQMPVAKTPAPTFAPVGTTAGEQAIGKGAPAVAPAGQGGSPLDFFQKATGHTPEQAMGKAKAWYGSLSPEQQQALLIGGVGAGGLAAGAATSQAMN